MRAAIATQPVNHHQAAAQATSARRAHADREARALAGHPADPASVVARMAEFIVTRAVGVAGNCTEQDLRQAGFTENDLKRLPEASRLAARQAPGLQGGA